MDAELIEVTPANIEDHPQSICFINPKQETFPLKVDWFRNQHEKGLEIWLLYMEGEKKPVGYIEFVPGEQAWRGVAAEGYLFVHCIWTYGKKFQHQGLGARLVEKAVSRARGSRGVAVMTSSGPFMASSDLFLKYGFETADTRGKNQLLVKQNKKGRLPQFSGTEEVLAGYQDMHIVYSKQCPWVARFIHELDEDTVKKWNIKIREIETAEEAQNGPSVYGIFTLMYNGRILADRYISQTRFKNILNKLEG